MVRFWGEIEWRRREFPPGEGVVERVENEDEGRKSEEEAERSVTAIVFCSESCDGALRTGQGRIASY